MFSVGSKVRCINAKGYNLKKGEVYTVNSVGKNGRHIALKEAKYSLHPYPVERFEPAFEIEITLKGEQLTDTTLRLADGTVIVLPEGILPSSYNQAVQRHDLQLDDIAALKHAYWNFSCDFYENMKSKMYPHIGDDFFILEEEWQRDRP